MQKRYKLIGCEILFREICLCAAQSKNVIDLEFLPKGLHDIGEKAMSEALQKAINNVDCAKYDAILLCYGLCNNGVRGLFADIPIIIPRAHDCITLFLGSKERYADYFHNNPGTYFHTSGWLERGTPNDTIYNDFVEKYGEENALYLMETLGGWTKNYKKNTFVDTNVGDSEYYHQQSAADAKDKGFEYERVTGDIRLVADLTEGNWNDDDFLIVPPKCKITPSFDDSIVTYT
jgi:hypothetical protein